MEYTNSETLLNPGNRGVDPSVGLTGYRLCDELNKQLRVCAGQRGWNTNFKQKENNLKKAANEISRKLASFSLSFRIKFVALMLSVPLLSHRRGQVLLFTYGAHRMVVPKTHSSYSYSLKTFLPPRSKSPKTFFPLRSSQRPCPSVH